MSKLPKGQTLDYCNSGLTAHNRRK